MLDNQDMTLNDQAREQIIAERERVKLTRAELAERMGRSPQHLQQLETGGRSIKLHNLEEIAGALDVDVSVALGDASKTRTLELAANALDQMVRLSNDESVPFDENPRLFLLAAWNLIATYAEDNLDYTSDDFAINLDTLYRAYLDEFDLVQPPPAAETKSSAKNVIRLSEAARRLSR